MPSLKQVFGLDPKGVHLRRGVATAVILAGTWFVTRELDDERYFLTA